MYILSEVKQHFYAFKEKLQKSPLLISILALQKHSSNPLAISSNFDFLTSK